MDSSASPHFGVVLAMVRALFADLLLDIEVSSCIAASTLGHLVAVDRVGSTGWAVAGALHRLLLFVGVLSPLVILGCGRQQIVSTRISQINSFVAYRCLWVVDVSLGTASHTLILCSIKVCA